MDPRKTGELIAKTRKARGLTQEQLADQLHLSHTTVSKWERGQGFPEVSLLEPLAGALGLTLDELFSGERTPKLSSRLVKGAQKDVGLGHPDISKGPLEKPLNEEAIPAANGSPSTEDTLLREERSPVAGAVSSSNTISECTASQSGSQGLWRRAAFCLVVALAAVLVGLSQRYVANSNVVGGDPTRLEGVWRFVPSAGRQDWRRGIPTELYLDQPFSEYIYLQVDVSAPEESLSAEDSWFTLCIGAYQVDEGQWEALGDGRYRLTGELLDTVITLKTGKTWDKRSKMGYFYLTLPGVEGSLLLVKRSDPGEYVYVPWDAKDSNYNAEEREAYRALLIP